MRVLTLVSALAGTSSALTVQLDQASSVDNATKQLVGGILDYYPPAGNDESKKRGWPLGTFQQPYYWWESGVAWGALIDYQYLTGDDSYNDMIKDAMVNQAGTNGDYIPSNQSMTEGNDDQGFWGIAAMAAAERNFTNPAADQHGWLYSAQAVFNTMADRWDSQNCNGGLRWQIYTWNSGYDYKNTVSNGCLFNIAARLARYTGNSTYADWAAKTFNWLKNTGFIDQEGDQWQLYDGASINQNCTQFSKSEYTYTYGLMLSGSAFMYDYTNGSSYWDTAVKELWTRASSIFFENGIMYEQACQASGKCNNDQRCFKGIFSRFLGHVGLFVPDVSDDVMGKLNSSAAAAANSCSGGTDGHTCGLNWFNGYDGEYGLGEEISALEVIQNTQVLSHPKPYTKVHGGSSNGSSNAGEGVQTANPLTETGSVSSGDKAGAGVVTGVLLIFLISVGAWMLF